MLNANVSEEKAGRENRVPPRYQRPTSDRIAGPIGRPGGNDSHFFSLQEREFPIFFFEDTFHATIVKCHTRKINSRFVLFSEEKITKLVSFLPMKRM